VFWSFPNVDWIIPIKPEDAPVTASRISFIAPIISLTMFVSIPKFWYTGSRAKPAYVFTVWRVQFRKFDDMSEPTIPAIGM
jgi:hypothetical protein